MRVAMFLGGFPFVSETFILRQITGLIDQGHHVDIFAGARPPEEKPVHPEVQRYALLTRTTYLHVPQGKSHSGSPVGSATARGDVPLLDLPSRARTAGALARCLVCAPRVLASVLENEEPEDPIRRLAAVCRLSRLCSVRHRYDVLHAHFGPVGDAFRFAKELWKAPLVVTFYGYDFSRWPAQQGRDVYRSLFAVADAVNVICDYSWRRLEDLGCPPEKLHLLPLGVDPEAFPFSERLRRSGEPVRLLTVSRLVEKKGVEYAIRAVARVREKHPDLHYDIIGDGPLRPRIERLIHELGLAQVVTLHGARDGEEVRRHMAQAHLFVLSSVTAADGDQEGTPVVLLEAQAAGLPVLTTQHSGIPETIVPGKSGFLVPEGDLGGLVEQLAYLVAHPERWPEMGREGRRHVEERFDIRRLNRQLADLYEAVIAGYPVPEPRRPLAWRIGYRHG